MAVATTIVAVTPAPAFAAGLTPYAGTEVTLTQDLGAYQGPINQLTTELKDNIRSVDQVMAAANRSRQTLCHQTTSSYYGPYKLLEDRSGADVAGFCWESSDENDKGWTPEGITTTFDASSTGLYQGHKLVVMAWYDQGTGHTQLTDYPRCGNKETQFTGTVRGIRISIVDWDPTYPNTYRHILLVEPKVDSNGHGTFAPIVNSSNQSIHAGGIAWVGDSLYVADTTRGIRIFDMTKIFEVNSTDSTKVGYQGGSTYEAFGARYVLPQSGWARVKTANAGVDPMRFSLMSADVSNGGSLLVGEYTANLADANPGDPRYNHTTPRLLRFALAGNGLATQADGVTVQPSQAFRMTYTQAAGVTGWGGKVWISESNGCANKPVDQLNGTLHFINLSTPGTAKNFGWTFGAEGLSYAHDKLAGAPDLLWTNTENVGYRAVVNVPQNQWD